MLIKMKAGRSFPLPDDSWVKIDIDLELTGEEIDKPKKHKIKERVEKGVKLCEKYIGKEMEKQREKIVNSVK